MYHQRKKTIIIKEWHSLIWWLNLISRELDLTDKAVFFLPGVVKIPELFTKEQAVNE